jgi:hypothetical protein
MTATAPSASQVPSVEGVTLEQYAGVSAAIIEGFALPAVLAAEGLDARAWPRVSLRWSRRVAEGGAAGPLAVAYRDTLAFARGWLGRRVAPLEDDLGVWLAFLNAWSAHPDPFAPLEELSILPSDVTRVQGAWAQKVEKDEELRKKALEIAKKKPSAVPRGPALPFVAGEAPEEIALPEAEVLEIGVDGEEKPLAHATKPRNKLVGTALALDVPRGPAMPFAGAKGGAEIQASGAWKADAALTLEQHW